MTERDFRFAPRGEKVWVRGAELWLESPSAAALRCAQQEAQSLDDSPLAANACLLARGLTRQGRPVFSNGQEVLNTLSAEEIQRLCSRLGGLAEAASPSPEDELGRTEEWMERLREDAYGRLRWKVQRAFGALPSEERVARMSDGDYLYCIANLLLDEEARWEQLCPQCRQRREETRCACCGQVIRREGGGENGAFDRARFEQLRRGKADGEAEG